jgi:hypothetical protein
MARPFRGFAAERITDVGHDREAVPLAVKEPHNAGPKQGEYATGDTTMTIKITPNERGNPPGKLADAEIHFTDGPLEGLKLIGFSVWDVRRGDGRNVTFPARQYNVNGERRSFALLRPIVDTTAQSKVRELILDAYAEWEAQASVTS